MKKDDEKGMHEGHRGRLLELVKNAGLENVSEVQAVEFFLTYIFPRGDVNPLAHRLLDRFGSFTHIFDADEVDLITVNGIGERAASMIHQFSEIFNLYTMGKLSKKEPLTKPIFIYDYCEQLLRMSNIEKLYIIGLDAQSRLIEKRCLAQGTINMVGISHSEISRFLLTYKPTCVIIAHNHPGGSAVASIQDVDATSNLQQFLESHKIGLYDHFVIGSDGIYSILKNKMGREFIPIID